MLGTLVIENIGGAGGGLGAAASDALASGRLHAAARRCDHAHHRGAAQDQADLRSAEGPGADLADRSHRLRDRGASVGAGQGPQGVRRLRQGQSGQGVIWLGRTRLAQSSHRRTVQAPGRADRSAARAVSRRGAGTDRPAGGANSLVGAGDDQHRAGASPRRQVASAGGDTRTSVSPPRPSCRPRSSRAFPTWSRRTSSACSRRPACRRRWSIRCRPPT